MKKVTKGSKTLECLMKSFVGEGAGRNRYTYFAKAAKEEGYMQIASIFLETADNELAHAKRFFKFMGEEFDEIMIKSATYPSGLSKKTVENLQFAANGEHEENTFLYPAFAKIAEEEGYIEVSDNYKEIIEVEKAHETRYLELMKNILEDKVFKRDKEVIWKCRNCGYLHKGKEAPLICPSCMEKTEYFELFVKNY